MFTKSAIPLLFNRHATHLDPNPYLAAAQVFPLRVNSHVAEDLIDWQVNDLYVHDPTVLTLDRSNTPQDPMFQLSFPQPAMLTSTDLEKIQLAVQSKLPKTDLQQVAEEIRRKMNPHPANQRTENVPRLRGQEMPGMQHKYRETVLFFPSEVGNLEQDFYGSRRLMARGE